MTPSQSSLVLCISSSYVGNNLRLIGLVDVCINLYMSRNVLLCTIVDSRSVSSLIEVCRLSVNDIVNKWDRCEYLLMSRRVSLVVAAR